MSSKATVLTLTSPGLPLQLNISYFPHFVFIIKPIAEFAFCLQRCTRWVSAHLLQNINLFPTICSFSHFYTFVLSYEGLKHLRNLKTNFFRNGATKKRFVNQSGRLVFLDGGIGISSVFVWKLDGECNIHLEDTRSVVHLVDMDEQECL